MKRFTMSLVSILLFTALNAATAIAYVYDDFEDGILDTSKWAVGGRRVSWTPTGEGAWQWSAQEIPGHLELRSWGPPSGNSYGAVAWTRQTLDLNRGENLVENFRWDVEAPLRWGSVYMQITDGDNLPTFAQAHWGMSLTPPLDWLRHDYPGWKNLLWDTRDDFPAIHTHDDFPSIPFQDYSGTSSTYTWSISVDPGGLARLYDGPDATGAMLWETTLDSSQHWYPRFLIYSGTSAGYPEGDFRFNLFDVEVTPEPSSLVAWSIGSVALWGWCRWRRRRQ